jgi:hypothetical protein
LPEAAVRDELFVLQELADLGEPLKVFVAVAVVLDDQSLFIFGKLAMLVFGNVLGMLGFTVVFGLAELEDGVVLELLFDAFLQRHQRQLEDLHRLDHARREQLALLHAHRS